MSAFGDSVENRFVHVVPLEVAPRLFSVPDVLLFLVPGDGSPATELIEALRMALERGLSHDRRQRVAATLLDAIEQSADAVELTDLDGRLFYVNPAWERFSGYSKPGALGLTVGEVFRDSKAPLLIDPVLISGLYKQWIAGLAFYRQHSCFERKHRQAGILGIRHDVANR